MENGLLLPLLLLLLPLLLLLLPLLLLLVLLPARESACRTTSGCTAIRMLALRIDRHTHAQYRAV